MTPYVLGTSLMSTDTQTPRPWDSQPPTPQTPSPWDSLALPDTQALGLMGTQTPGPWDRPT